MKNEKYNELDMIHENAKIMSDGNPYAYLALMILQLVMLCIYDIKTKIVNMFKKH